MIPDFLVSSSVVCCFLLCSLAARDIELELDDLAELFELELELALELLELSLELDLIDGLLELNDDPELNGDLLDAALELPLDPCFESTLTLLEPIVGFELDHTELPDDGFNFLDGIDCLVCCETVDSDVNFIFEPSLAFVLLALILETLGALPNVPRLETCFVD